MEVSVTDSTNRTHVTSKLTLAGSIMLSHWQVDCHREEFATDKISLADRVMSLLSTPSWPWGPEWQRRSSLSFTTSVRLLADWRLAGVVGFFGVMSVIRWSHWRIFSLTTDLLLRGPLLGRLEEKQIELKITFAKDFHTCMRDRRWPRRDDWQWKMIRANIWGALILNWVI